MKQENTAQPMKEQRTTVKNVFLASIVTGIVTGVVVSLMNIGMQRYTDVPYATFGAVECKSLRIVDDEGKGDVLIAVGDQGGFLHINGEDSDRQKIGSFSIGESGAELFLNGAKGSIIVRTGEGVHIYDKDGNIDGIRIYDKDGNISGLPKHTFPDTTKNR